MTLSGLRISRVHVSVNGVYSERDIPVRYTLAEFLREEMGLTGTKLGCNRAECGACTVLLDGKPVFSCTVLAAEADGSRVETVEGVALTEGLHPIHAALLKHDGLQCGFCTPGIVVSLKAMLDANPNPTTDDVKKAIAGNFCRCGAYQNIFEAMAQVSKAGAGHP